jgi:hypothetical protein
MLSSCRFNTNTNTSAQLYLNQNSLNTNSLNTNSLNTNSLNTNSDNSIISSLSYNRHSHQSIINQISNNPVDYSSVSNQSQVINNCPQTSSQFSNNSEPNNIDNRNDYFNYSCDDQSKDWTQISRKNLKGDILNNNCKIFKQEVIGMRFCFFINYYFLDKIYF